MRATDGFILRMAGPDVVEVGDYAGLSDVELVSRTRTGDVVAVEHILSRYGAAASRSVRAVPATEDNQVPEPSQSALLLLMEAVSRYPIGSGLPFREWLDHELAPHGQAGKSRGSVTSDELQALCRARGLSKLETKVYRLYIQGYSYDAMSQSIGCSSKSVDNALQRARRKIDTLRTA